MLIFQENHVTHSLEAKYLTSSMVSESKIFEKSIFWPLIFDNQFSNEFSGIFNEIRSLDWSKLKDLPDDILNSGFAKEGMCHYNNNALLVE